MTEILQTLDRIKKHHVIRRRFICLRSTTACHRVSYSTSNTCSLRGTTESTRDSASPQLLFEFTWRGRGKLRETNDWKWTRRNHTFSAKFPMQQCIRKYVFITERLSAHLNSYISERSRKANNLSRDHTLVKIIAKLWDAYSFNYQPASPGSFADIPVFCLSIWPILFLSIPASLLRFCVFLLHFFLLSFW